MGSPSSQYISRRGSVSVPLRITGSLLPPASALLTQTLCLRTIRITSFHGGVTGKWLSGNRRCKLFLKTLHKICHQLLVEGGGPLVRYAHSLCRFINREALDVHQAIKLLLAI